MASKFFNMMMLLLISTFVGTIITSPVDVSSKSSEDLLLKAALESLNVNLSNYHVYKNGQLIDPAQIMTKNNFPISQVLLKNYDTNLNHTDGQINKRELSLEDIFDDQIGDKYLDKIIEQEIENGYEGNFPTYGIDQEYIPNGIRFTITYYKGTYISCSGTSSGYEYESKCIAIVEHLFGSEISLQNVVYFQCKDVSDPKSVNTIEDMDY